MSDLPFRIVHLTVYGKLPSGIRNQIKWEQAASKHLVGVAWSSLAVHEGAPVETFERRIPSVFRLILLRNLYGWFIAFRLARTCDVLLLRHMVSDPFVLICAPLIRNRISVHHSREWEELPLIRPGAIGRLAGLIEQFTGLVSVRCAIGVLGVTTEISRFQVAHRAPSKPAGLYANGIYLDAVQVVDDDRKANDLNIVFMSNTFSEWHGLDRLVDAVRDSLARPENLTFHIIGHLSNLQKSQIVELGSRSALFRLHGFLDASAYRHLLALADVGLGSFAMDRQNLREGATLKVREMLGIGLPVYSGHVDTAIPSDFLFYQSVSEINLSDLSSFARSMKQFSRLHVRTASAPFIDKVSTMQVAADWLRHLMRSRNDTLA